VASRLEALAKPGGILVTGTVHDHTSSKLDVAFEDLGEQTVKNLKRPIHVYRVVAAESGETPSIGERHLQVLAYQRSCQSQCCPSTI
jgi:class 3 adenylate cyclase